MGSIKFDPDLQDQKDNHITVHKYAMSPSS